MIVHQPYRSLTDIVAGLGLSQDESTLAWSIINDHYLTDLPLLYPPHVIACTAAFMAVVLKPSPSNLGSTTQATPTSVTNSNLMSNLSAADTEAVSAKHQKMVSWLAGTNVDMEAVIDCTQEIISLYEAVEQYNEKVCKEQIARYVKALGLDK